MITKQTVMAIKAADVRAPDIGALLNALKEIRARRPGLYSKSHLSRARVFNLHKDVCRFDWHKLSTTT